MFYLTQSINSALKPLEIEAVDARLGKNTQKFDVMDDEYPDNDNAENVMGINAEEYTILSVKSIILFLEDYLEERLTSTVYDHNNKEDKILFPPWFSKQQSNDIGGKVISKAAIAAYAHAAEISYNSGKFEFPRDIDLQLNAIYSLIKNLRVLQGNGVEYLKIYSRRTLIKGVVAAIKEMDLIEH